MKRGLVISGGGSKGAYAGGVLEYLIEQNIKWDVGASASTGTMLLPLTLLGDIFTLKKYFTSITDKDIFNINAFNKKGKFRFLNAIKRLILSKTSLGEGNNLFKLLHITFTEEKWKLLKNSNIDLYVTVTNLTKGKVEYKSIQDFDYETFMKFMLASASIPAVFDIVTIDNNQYADGGILETVPLKKMVEQDCDEIDIIVLRVKEDNLIDENNKCDNIIDVLLRTINLMNKEIGYDDIKVGTLIGEKNEIKLNFYYLPYNFKSSAIEFNPTEMTKWWKLGYEYANNKTGYKQVILKKYKTGYKIK